MREPWEKGLAGRLLRRAFVISAGVHALILLIVLLIPPHSRPVTWSASGTGVSLVSLAGPAGGSPGPARALTAPPARVETPKVAPKPAPKPTAKKPAAKPTPAKPGPARPVPVADPPETEAAATPPAGGGGTGNGRGAGGAGAGNGGGGSGGGGSGPLSLMAQADGGPFVYDYYLQTVAEMISRAWEPPAGLTERAGETSATIKFRILANGRVSAAEVETASALDAFDRSARAAVMRAQPFPPLPPTYGGRWLVIHLKFAYGATS